MIGYGSVAEWRLANNLVKYSFVELFFSIFKVYNFR